MPAAVEVNQYRAGHIGFGLIDAQWNHTAWTIGKDIGLTTRWTMMQDLGRTGVSLKKRTKALEITLEGVRDQQDGEEALLPCDTVVLAAGAVSHNPLQALLEQKEIPCRVAGDANRIGLAFDAVHQGFAAGRQIG